MCYSYWTRTFEGLPEHVADVREFIGRVIGDVDGVDDVVLVASELSANAIRHSLSGNPGGSFAVQVVAFTDCWHVRVDDMGASSGPKPERAEDTDETGRGLPVVAALSRAWGTFGNGAGRTVWAEIAFPEDEEEPEFHEDDVVRVREEPALSVVVQPTHQAARRLPKHVPELGILCTSRAGADSDANGAGGGVAVGGGA